MNSLRLTISDHPAIVRRADDGGIVITFELDFFGSQTLVIAGTEWRQLVAFQPVADHTFDAPGQGELASALDAQYIFGEAVPEYGWCVQNRSAEALWVCGTEEASAGGASIEVPPNSRYKTSPDYVPTGPVTIFGTKRGQRFVALLRNAPGDEPPWVARL